MSRPVAICWSYTSATRYPSPPGRAFFPAARAKIKRARAAFGICNARDFLSKTGASPERRWPAHMHPLSSSLVQGAPSPKLVREDEGGTAVGSVHAIGFAVGAIMIAIGHFWWSFRSMALFLRPKPLVTAFGGMAHYPFLVIFVGMVTFLLSGAAVPEADGLLIVGTLTIIFGFIAFQLRNAVSVSGPMTKDVAVAIISALEASGKRPTYDYGEIRIDDQEARIEVTRIAFSRGVSVILHKATPKMRRMVVETLKSLERSEVELQPGYRFTFLFGALYSLLLALAIATLVAFAVTGAFNPSE